jgi:hypothetical protein
MSNRRSSKVAATQCNALVSAEFSARSETDSQDHLARLIRTIEGEIVPRMLVSFAGSLTAARHTPGPDNVAMLALRRTSEPPDQIEFERLGVAASFGGP